LFFYSNINDGSNYDALAKEIDPNFIKKALNYLFGCRRFRLRKKKFQKHISLHINLNITISTTYQNNS
ncbi:MAG: hypothetical protein ACRC6O_09195, partial [Flavobacterium sp.]